MKVFATGGIGGVHRGPLPDISADLPELAHTPDHCCVFRRKDRFGFAGDARWLETHAITVVGYQCDELPAFYSRRSGLPIDVRAESASDVARLFAAQRALGLESALLVTVPVPEEFEVPSDALQAVLNEALDEAERNAIGGRELTPFLLGHMAEHSGGSTLRANIALLENNARVAAEIAVGVGKGYSLKIGRAASLGTSWEGQRKIGRLIYGLERAPLRSAF